MDHALIALCALLLNVALAGPREWYESFGVPRIARLPAIVVRQIERKLNREHRSLKERELRGLLFTIFVVVMSLLLGWLCHLLFTSNLRFAELLVVAIFLPVRPTWDLVSRLRRYLQHGNIAAARQLLEHSPWRHHALLDNYGLARAGIETLAVHFGEKIFAAVFWYLAFGLPGLFVSKALFMLQEIVARPPAPAQGFSLAPYTLHYFAHYIPSRLSLIFWLITALFMPGVKPVNVVKQVMEHYADATPQALALLMSGSVLQLALGGPSSIYTQGQWLGGGIAKATVGDVRRALYSFALLQLFVFVLLGLLLR